MMSTPAPVVQRLERLLQQHLVDYHVLTHAPVFTSEQAAAVRGTPLASGAKALVVNVDGAMKMFVLPADRKLSSKKLRTRGAKSVRFASADEVFGRTGLKPGSIPPFGSLFGLATVCDPRLGDNASINFNAGDHAISVSLAYADYVAVEQPELADVSE